MSTPQDELARLSRAFAARSRSPSQHPEPEQVFDAAAGHLEPSQRAQVIDHIAECAECTEAWRIAMELGVRPSEAIPSAVVPARGRVESSSVWKFALAASVVVGVGAVTYITLREQPASPQYRTGIDTAAPVSLVSRGRLPREQFLLRWSPGPAGSAYDVRVSTADLSALFAQQNLGVSELLVPSDALQRVSAGEQLLWQVEVRLPEGRRVSSETFVVTLE